MNKGFHNVWITCFYKRSTNEWQLLWGDEFMEGSFFDKLVPEIKKRSRKDTKSKYIVFINGLTSFNKNGFIPGKPIGTKTHEDGSEDILITNYGNLQFRNFDVFTPNNTQLIFENKENMAVYMREYLMELCKGKDPKDCAWSFGHTFLKTTLGVSPIHEILHEDIVKAHRNIWNEEMYQDLISGNKSGYSILPPEQGTLLENCDIYDLNSAYSSVIISDDCFPIGKIFNYSGDLVVDRFNKAKSQGWWYKVVFDEDACVPHSLESFRDKRTNKIGIEYYDYKALVEFYGMKEEEFLEIMNNNIGKCRAYAAVPGRLHRVYRDVISDLYEKKQSLPKDSLERLIVKQGLEILYGKSIQFNTRKDANTMRGIFSDGISYLLPHMGMHCSAAIRYRLVKAHHSVEIDYADTDCIQGQNLEEYVKKDNEEQMFKNKLACNNSDIGCWKEENKNCTQTIIGKKQRIIYDPQKGEFDAKVAGCNKKYVLAHIKKMMEKYNSNVYLCLCAFLGNELKNVMLERYVPVKNGYKTEIVSYGKTENYKKWVLGKDDENV